jgi:hypothetical protein
MLHSKNWDLMLIFRKILFFFFLGVFGVLISDVIIFYFVLSLYFWTCEKTTFIASFGSCSLLILLNPFFYWILPSLFET